MSSHSPHPPRNESSNAWSTLIGYLPGFFKYAGVGAPIAFAAGAIVYFAGKRADDLAKPDYIRGLLTTIFALSTMSIAVILACAGLFKDAEAGREQELKDRFQRGKEILTLLLGIFGTILGFYFGTAYPPHNTNVPPRPDMSTSATNADGGK